MHQALTACAAISEARAACASVTLAADGVVVGVDAVVDEPLTAEELTCVRDKLLGRCLPQLLGQQSRFCVQGM